MAGGIAVGSTGGALAEPVVGWQGLFVTVAVLATVIGAVAMSTRAVPKLPRPAEPLPLRTVARGYASLLGQSRARRTYCYVLINSVLHSGVYTWLGLYLHQRFGLGPTGIGLALLGYGVPGFVLGPLIGTTADRYGRARLIPLWTVREPRAPRSTEFAVDRPLASPGDDGGCVVVGRVRRVKARRPLRPLPARSSTPDQSFAASASAWCSRIRHEGPLMLKTTARCIRRSRMALATTGSPKTSPHAGSPRLVVTRVGWPRS